MNVVDKIIPKLLEVSKQMGTQKEIEEFISNPENHDFLEEISIQSSGYEGFVTLSSGKTAYISQPKKSGEEIGKSLKKISDRINNIENN